MLNTPSVKGQWKCWDKGWRLDFKIPTENYSQKNEGKQVTDENNVQRKN